MITKSKILLQDAKLTAEDTITDSQPRCNTTLVDGMVLAQELTKKPATALTTENFSEYFTARLMTKNYDEIILVEECCLRTTNARKLIRQAVLAAQYIPQDVELRIFSSDRCSTAGHCKQ